MLTKRDFSAKRFGDQGYAREELVAELGAACLCADLGITPEIRDDHAAYLGHWLQALKEDKRAIFSSGPRATRRGLPAWLAAAVSGGVGRR
jgi:antirestriction protein ArdC